MASEEPLAAVRCGVLRAWPRLAAIPHVVALLTQCLDVSATVSLASAAGSRSKRLFDRVAVRLLHETAGDDVLREYWFARALQTALERDDLEMARRVHSFHGEPLFVCVPIAGSLAFASSLGLALRYGSLETVQWVVANRRDRQCCGVGVQNLCRGCVVRELSSIGDRDVERIVHWLIDSGALPVNNSRHVRFLWAALLLSVELIRWVHERALLTPPLTAMLLSQAVEQNRADVVAFLVESGVRLPAETAKARVIIAACRGHDQVVDVLLAHGEWQAFHDKFSWEAPTAPGVKKRLAPKPTLTQDSDRPLLEFVRETALGCANVEILRWVHELRPLSPTLPISHSELASEDAVLELFQWLHAQGIDPWTEHDVNDAASKGFLRVLQWLNDHCTRGWTTAAMDEAASNRHSGVVKWLHTNRTEGCTSRAMKAAAGNGDLRLVQRLCEHRPESNVSTALVYAADGGHLDVLKWLLQQGVGTCTSCLSSKVLQQRLSTPSSTQGPVGPYILRWLRANPMDLCARCSSGDAKKLKTGAMHRAAHGDLDVMKLLHDDYLDEVYLVDPHQVVRSIAHEGHLPIAQWVKERFQLNPPDSGGGHDTDWQDQWNEAILEARQAGHEHVAEWILSLRTSA